MKKLLLAALFAVTPALAQQAITVGAALPETGILADLATDLRKALLLWQEEVNAAGGLLGRRVELQLLDSRSETLDSPKLYEQLIREHKVDVLIGPFGSGATQGAAAVAERNRRVMINATGAARTVHRKGYRYVFQTVAPLGSYGMAALELVRAQGLKRVVLLARDDPTSREMATRARGSGHARALRRGGRGSSGGRDRVQLAGRARARRRRRSLDRVRPGAGCSGDREEFPQASLCAAPVCGAGRCRSRFHPPRRTG